MTLKEYKTKMRELDDQKFETRETFVKSLYSDGYTKAQISEISGIPESTVRYILKDEKEPTKKNDSECKKDVGIEDVFNAFFGPINYKK